MKKKSFIRVCIMTHSVLIFLIVYKHTLFIKESYIQQETEKKKNALLEKKALLTQQFHALKDHATIKTFAQKTLRMKPFTLRQIKKLHEYG